MEKEKEVKKISWQELYDTFYNFNLHNKDDKRCMTGVVVYKKEGFKPEFQSLKARSYQVWSNSTAFIPGKMGRCIVGRSLDGLDPHLRLDAQDWPIEYCYLLEDEIEQ